MVSICCKITNTGNAVCLQQDNQLTEWVLLELDGQLRDGFLSRVISTAKHLESIHLRKYISVWGTDLQLYEELIGRGQISIAV